VYIANNPRVTGAAFLFAVAFAAFPAQLPAQVSLATVVDLAQRNSATVRLAQADLNKAQTALAQTKAVYIPSVELGSGLPAMPAVGFTGGLPSILNGTIQSLVFSFPQLKYIQAARAGFKAASLNLEDAREQVALDASTAYIELDTVNRELDAAHEQESLSGRLVQIEKERAEAGVDPTSDWLQAQLTSAELKLKRIHLETRAASLEKQLSLLTGLPFGAIKTDRTSIPEIPAVRADDTKYTPASIQSAQMLAVSKQKVARGEVLNEYFPQVSFSALYSRNTTILNDFNSYYSRPIPTNNFSSGFSIQIPLFDVGRAIKAKQTAAEALRATVEAEQAQQQNDIQIASLTGSLRELDALAEIAGLKQQIAGEQLQTVLAQLEVGNGAGNSPGAPPQLSPKAEQLARIDERQKFQEALDAGFQLSKARLGLLRALGHMEDWLHELHAK
jgi:outer membrane protein TolC